MVNCHLEVSVFILDIIMRNAWTRKVLQCEDGAILNAK